MTVQERGIEQELVTLAAPSPRPDRPESDEEASEDRRTA